MEQTTRRLPGLWMIVLVPFLLAGGSGMFIGSAHGQALIAQDLNYDGDVDLDDFGQFQICLGRPQMPHQDTPTCRAADVDQDGDVDLSDFGILQRCYSGPGVLASMDCGGCAMPLADRSVGATASTIPTGGSSRITVGNSQPGASYQLLRQPGSVPVGTPIAGTGGTIELPTAALTSSTTFNVLASNTRWGCSVMLAAGQTIEVSPYSPLNKIGVHIVIGPRNGYGDFIRTCANAGKPVALVKCLDDFGPAAEAKQYSPQTLTIGRVNEINGHDLQGLDYLVGNKTPAEGAAWYYQQVKPKWQQNPAIDVWETCNEWSWHWAWQADFYIAFMDLAEADGYRLALWSCSGGNPPEAYYSDIARACARAKAHGNHILSLHEYSWDGLLKDAPTSLVTRYRRLYAYLATQNAVIPLAITEAGENGGGGFTGPEVFVDDFGWYDTQMRQDPYVIGCAAWTLGNWSGANFQNALPALAQYIITH